MIDRPRLQIMLQRILMGSLIGAMIGCPAGAVGLLAWAVLREPFFLISIGFGLLGMLYTPLIGAVAGILLGAAVGAVIAMLSARQRAP